MPEPESRPVANFDLWLKLVSPLLAIAAFVWGVYTYQATAMIQIAKLDEESKRLSETRRIEASKPFLQRQLDLFTMASKAAAIVATTKDPAEAADQRKIFEQLYWGELGMVERGGVSKAMIDYKQALDAGKTQIELQTLSLRLSHALRDELGTAWQR